ncbi:MAG: HIRAN domain-containing protein [Dechloromonas sp.]|nr:HIRAN domain-containing protein [Dechloromonas sp.]
MPANRLRAPVAGYAYACDPAREAFFATGQPLALIREPENPHDSQAIRIEWRGEKVGYVPRPDNAELAAQIDAGATFAARIGDFVAQAPLWQRLWFEIVLDGGERP